jgi:hypothetical protein
MQTTDLEKDISAKLKFDVKHLEKLICTYGEHFTDDSIIKIGKKITKLINYIDIKYNDHYPENKIKNFIKVNSSHPELKLHFLVQGNKEIMEINFSKGGGHYYIEYLVNKTDILTFTKIREKYVQEHCAPQVIYYNIVLGLEDLVQDLNEY